MSVNQERLAQHKKMESLCSRWARQHGYPSSDDYKHKAPDQAFVKMEDGSFERIDFKQFYYQIPPWHVDLDPESTTTVLQVINPDGVAPSLDSTEHDSAPCAQGWTCTREGCKKWVDRAPRAFVGGSEPVDWWYCFECKKLPKPSKKELKRRLELQSNHRLDKMFKSSFE